MEYPINAVCEPYLMDADLPGQPGMGGMTWFD
jgi:hypothetical protein